MITLLVVIMTGSQPSAANPPLLQEQIHQLHPIMMVRGHTGPPGYHSSYCSAKMGPNTIKLGAFVSRLPFLNDNKSQERSLVAIGGTCEAMRRSNEVANRISLHGKCPYLLISS